MDAEVDFWIRAMKGLPWFRFLRRPLSVDHLDEQFQGSFLEREWEGLKTRMKPGDQIWPFEFNVRSYLGMRQGYLVLRRGKPIGGVVTVVS